MSDKHNRHKQWLTIHEESTLIKFVTEKFPGSSDIGYFSEIPGEKPDYQTLSWVYNAHRRLNIRMSWRTGKLHIKQELVVNQETRSITFPITWSGWILDFDENGEATLEETAARNFWAMLISRSDEDVPKPN